MPQVDVLVVGAGPAGSATAAALATVGHRVLLVDRARFPRPKPCAEYVSPGGVALLERLGLPTQVGRRLRGMQVVAPNGARHLIDYQGPDEARACQALSMPRTELDTRLFELAQARGADTRERFCVHGPLLEGGIVRGVVGRDASGARVELRARFVVGADGVHSALVRTLGLRRQVRWPARLGLVAHLRGGPTWREDFGQMWVGRRGYVGLAPLADDRVTVGLVVPLARRRLGSARTAFWAALAAVPGAASRLAGAEVVDDQVRGVGPLAHAVAATTGPGFLLVGDAAGFFDPFTGEGLYRALRGAALAAEAIDELLAGHADALSEYELARRRAFASKERLTALVQVFVRVPALMNYVVERLRRRPALAQQLARVLGDLEPADATLRPAYLWALLRA